MPCETNGEASGSGPRALNRTCRFISCLRHIEATVGRLAKHEAPRERFVIELEDAVNNGVIVPDDTTSMPD
jgi:hypothetical protein